MANDISDYLRNEIRKHLLRTGSWTKPTNLYVSLHTADPGRTGASEVSGGSYARVQRDPLDANWTGATAGASDNAAAITFPTPTANWGTITHCGLWDASSAGNFLWRFALTANKTVNNGDPAPSIAIGDIDWSLT